jgi:hypothetical protein
MNKLPDIKPYSPRSQRERVTGALVDALKLEVSSRLEAKAERKQEWMSANKQLDGELRAFKARLKYAHAKQKREWAEPVGFDVVGE